MTVWYVMLTALRPFRTMRQLVALVESTPKGQPTGQRDDVRRYLRLQRALAGRLRLTNCLPRALLAYRFLTLAGESPTLVVGMGVGVGHAWVEIDGAPLYENLSHLQRFQPILTLPPV
jgi:hypothetical protein